MELTLLTAKNLSVVYMNSFYCIKQGNKCIGLRDKDKSYVIGFRSSIQARHVQYSMHPEPVLEVRRVKPILSVTQEVTEGLSELNVFKTLKEPIIIDPDAFLRVPKAPYELSETMRDAGYHLATVEPEECICMPFTPYVGIIIPNEIIAEDDKEIILQCDIVEPIFDATMFKP